MDSTFLVPKNDHFYQFCLDTRYYDCMGIQLPSCKIHLDLMKGYYHFLKSAVMRASLFFSAESNFPQTLNWTQCFFIPQCVAWKKKCVAWKKMGGIKKMCGMKKKCVAWAPISFQYILNGLCFRIHI